MLVTRGYMMFMLHQMIEMDKCGICILLVLGIMAIKNVVLTLMFAIATIASTQYLNLGLMKNRL